MLRIKLNKSLAIKLLLSNANETPKDNGHRWSHEQKALGNGEKCLSVVRYTENNLLNA